MEAATFTSKIHSYVHELTLHKYDNYPSDIEKTVTQNLNDYALEVIAKIKAHPQKDNLLLTLPVCVDVKGYELITEYMKRFKISFSVAQYTNREVDFYPQEKHVLLKNIKIQLEKAIHWNPKIAYKADNPYIFPKEKPFTIIAPPYTSSNHCQSAWEKAKKGTNTDVEFRVGSRSFKAHRTVLIVHSEYFESMFHASMLETQTKQTIEIKDISPENFALVLEFIYTGELKEIDSLQQLLELIYAASLYRLTPLDGICCNRIQAILQKNSLDAAGLEELFVMATQIEDSLILPICLAFVEENQNMINTLYIVLKKENVDRFLKVATEKKLPFIISEINQCKKYNSSLK
jgi:hypothetical protein